MNSISVSTPIADDLRRFDRQHILHPWQHFSSFEREGALLMERGEGCWLFDVEGRRYLDAVGGLWCTSLGLGREEMVDAIAAQVRRLAYTNGFVDMSNPPAALLGRRLAELAPGALNHVIYTSGGSTAIDSAVRLIHFYNACRGTPEKRRILTRKQGYHGSTYLAASLTGKDRIPEFRYETDWIHLLSCPNPYRTPEGVSAQAFCDMLVAELENTIVRLGPHNVAAFLAEPVLGAGGVIVPPPGYNERTRAVCARHQVLYVADEVVTGFGRLGEWFASGGIFDLEPDILTCAKAITSGYVPLGACIYSDAIHDVVSQGNLDRYFGHGFTYSGHPVACAAALKTLEIIEHDSLLNNVREVGGYFERRLQELRDLPIVGDVRGIRLMMCVEFVADRRTKELFPESLNIGKRISNHCERLGLIVRSIVHLNIMSPAFILTREQVDLIVDTLRQGIEATMSELRREGLWHE